MNDFFKFLDSSPTSFHAVEEIKKRLDQKKISYRTNDGSLIAHIKPKKRAKKLIILVAHTDSPALKLKPNFLIQKENLTLLSSEVYGAPLLTSWLNRDLKIAGKVVYEKKGKFVSELVDWDDYKVTIPQLAIHLDREVNEKGLLLNKQDHLNAIFGYEPADKRFDKIKAHDLYLVSAEKAAFLSGEDFIASSRLDNLASCYEIIESLPSHTEHTALLAVFFDHEEVGSNTAYGAFSPFFNKELKEYEDLDDKLILSLDVAHTAHPNYLDKHDPNHRTQFGKGAVLKWNASKKYATDTSAISKLKTLPPQSFSSKSDMPSGSTVGPILSARLSAPTLDVGIPILSMHSIREMMAVKDHLAMITWLKENIN